MEHDCDHFNLFHKNRPEWQVWRYPKTVVQEIAQRLSVIFAIPIQANKQNMEGKYDRLGGVDSTFFKLNPSARLS